MNQVPIRHAALFRGVLTHGGHDNSIRQFKVADVYGPKEMGVVHGSSIVLLGARTSDAIVADLRRARVRHFLRQSPLQQSRNNYLRFFRVLKLLFICHGILLMLHRLPSAAAQCAAVLIAGFSAVCNAAAADTGAAGSATTDRRDDALAEITVLAQRTTPEIARDAERQAPNLINILTSEEMQKLPDVNTGEAIRRVPGISLETDTGEGRYINIRGLDADLNSTTFGGLRLPPTNNSSPSGAGRAVAFDSIPVGFVGAIKVTKSNLPEQDAEALGGTIDITPKTAPSDGKPFAELHAGTGMELLRHTWITDLAGTAGARFGGSGDYHPFSILITASTYDDRRGVDDAEAAFIDNQPAGIPDKAFAAFEQRFYNYHRERHGYGADLGFAPDADNQYFIRYYDAGYSETVNRNRLIWNFTGAPTADPNNPNGFIDTGTFTKALREEKEYLDSKVVEIGGKNEFAGNILDYHVGYTKGTYVKPYDLNSGFDNPSLANVAYDNTTRPNWPAVQVLPGTPANGTVNVNPYDPAGYVLSGLNTQSQHKDDHELGIGANLAIPTHFTDRSDEQIKVGVNARIRRNTADQTSAAVANVPALPLTSLSYGGNFTYYDGHYSMGPQIDTTAIRALYAAAVAAGNISGDPIGNALADVHDKENVYAVYGQYQFGYGALGIVAGVRVEKTQATYAGFASDSSGSAASLGCPILDPINNPTTHVCAVSNDRNYTNYFPTAQARYEIQPDLVARAAISSTIARPGFQQVTSATTVDASGNITTGNPNLKPTTATGLDLALEKYLPHAGIASIGFFAKDIKNYIVTNVQQTAGGQQNLGGNLGIVKVISFANASTATLYGFETDYVQHFSDILPGPLGGLGVSANWTWVDSQYNIPVFNDSGVRIGTRPSLLPSSSRNTFNADVLYDMYNLSMTLGAYYTSRNIFGVGGTAALDVWSQERLSVDFGSQYKLTEAASVYFNAKNLTNTALKFTEGPGPNRVIQREYYGTTLQFGANFEF
jgi:TonB-dependent receptor